MTVTATSTVTMQETSTVTQTKTEVSFPSRLTRFSLVRYV